MIKLFKAKSLKKTQETGAGARGAGVQGASMRGAGVQGAGVRGAGIGAGVRGVEVGASMRGAGDGAGARGAGAKLTSSLNERTQEKEKSKGRSMVEMLGVLAIIGVLSIGGISGYTIAMRRYRANEIVNVMNKYATVLYTHCQMKMQNDPKNYPHIRSCNGYYDYSSRKWVNGLLSFTDAGLGPLPNGVVDVASEYGDVYETFIMYETLSNDMVEVSLLIDNQPLCQVISDMMNEGDRGKHPYYLSGPSYPTPCQEMTKNGKTGYHTHIAFYVS